VIKKFGITLTNMTEKLGFLLNSKDPNDHLAAADIYSLFGQANSSTDQYLRFVAEVPTRGKVWLALGRTELTKSDQQNSNPYLAAIFLKNAINAGWKTWESYSYLALSYYRVGDTKNTEAAVVEELKIDPNNEDAKRWTNILLQDKLDKINAEQK
jgi:predicted Zn-dependent protease